MSEGDPSFHRMANVADAMALKLRTLFSHFRSEERAKAAASRAARAYISSYPSSFTLFHSYIDALDSLNWQSLTDQQVLQLFEQFPSRASTSVQTQLYQYSWPLELAAQVREVWPRSRVVLEPPFSAHGKTCDLFVYNDDPSSPGKFSRWTDENGICHRGVAFECKSMEAEAKLSRRIREASQQLKRYRAGIVAIDVSALIAPLAAQSTCLPDFYATVRREHTRIHDTVARIVAKDHGALKDAIAGVTVRCRLTYSPVQYSGACPHIQMYEYNRAIGFSCAQDELARLDVEHVIWSALGDYSRLYIVPLADRLFYIKSGGRLYMQIVTDAYVPMVRLCREKPVRGFGMAIVSVPGSGSGDSYLSGAHIGIVGCPTCPFWTASGFRLSVNAVAYPGASNLRLDNCRWQSREPARYSWTTPEGAAGYNFPITEAQCILIEARTAAHRPNGPQ